MACAKSQAHVSEICCGSAKLSRKELKRLCLKDLRREGFDILSRHAHIRRCAIAN